jgi:hypothetical protein
MAPTEWSDKSSCSWLQVDTCLSFVMLNPYRYRKGSACCSMATEHICFLPFLFSFCIVSKTFNGALKVIICTRPRFVCMQVS